ncbi:MAG: 4Fe-4S dicluster domain-containing protein [Dehalococcoidaceae bacterium]|nr:4Fe-4S dicluster domain-containing protein [Dehalococcoidaceae bacterium]
MSKISRREFLKDAGLAFGGLLAGAGASVIYSGEYGESSVPKAGKRLVQPDASESACTGCGTCELVCAAFHQGAAGPNLRRIWLERNEDDLNCRILACQQCDYPACYYACPLQGKALCIEKGTGTRYINPDECSPGCQECIKACPLEPSRINYDPERRTALMCDMCRGRPAGPACVEFCPSRCLKLEVAGA